MITSVLFDMDGVLIDSQPLHCEADVRTLKYFGVTASTADVEKYAGTTNMDRYTRFKIVYHLANTVEEMVAYREKCIMDLVYCADLSAISGILELLESIKSLGLKTAVASSSSYDLIFAVLDKLNIRHYFDKIISGEDMENGKPAPDIFLAAAKALESRPEQCVVIEDSGNGVLAARRAHMKVIGYKNPSSGFQDLSGATEVTDDFYELSGKHLTHLA